MFFAPLNRAWIGRFAKSGKEDAKKSDILMEETTNDKELEA